MIPYRRLILFNLELSSESSLLRSNLAWVQAFMVLFDDVLVVSTKVGTLPSFLQGTRVIELGGGSFLKRIRAVWRLTKLIPGMFFHRREIFIFHHMSHRTAVYPGIVARIFGIKQGLWYSHEHSPKLLMLATLIVEKVFSPSRVSFPLKSSKLLHIGQAIDVDRFDTTRNLDSYNRTNEIITVGRISRSKHLTEIFEVFSPTPFENTNSKIWFIGPIQDPLYKREIELTCAELNVRGEFPGLVDASYIPTLLTNFCYYFSGTSKGVDRALIEAGASGCLILTTNIGALKLIGMNTYWQEIFGVEVPSLHLQYQHLNALSPLQRQYLGSHIKDFTVKHNDVNLTAGSILSSFLD